MDWKVQKLWFINTKLELTTVIRVLLYEMKDIFVAFIFTYPQG